MRFYFRSMRFESCAMRFLCFIFPLIVIFGIIHIVPVVANESTPETQSIESGDSTSETLIDYTTEDDERLETTSEIHNSTKSSNPMKLRWPEFVANYRKSNHTILSFKSNDTEENELSRNIAEINEIMTTGNEIQECIERLQELLPDIRNTKEVESWNIKIQQGEQYLEEIQNSLENMILILK